MRNVPDSRDGLVRPTVSAEVGVFGGSGFSSFLEDAEEVTVEPRFGALSGAMTVGMLKGVRVVFLCRRGPTPEWPPHRVNDRANVDAMQRLGVRAPFASFTAGSVQSEIHPGDFIVVDQLVDRNGEGA
jgi:5'-methylthioadenosine phosphorylase